jgi:2,3-bisphosphoglycerate-dependent phosphoglycerate mutase
VTPEFVDQPGAGQLVLLRHGQSTSNAQNVFTGWTDVPLGRSWLPVYRSWRLNERHYGALTGRRKSEVAAEVDPATFHAWRRSYTTAPPPMPPGSRFDVSADDRYADLPPDTRPRTESLADVRARILPYWADTLVPQIRAGGAPLVVTHGNALRALIMHLDGLDDQQVTGLDIPTAAPIIYRFDDRLRPRPAGCHYLDPATANEPVRIGGGQPRVGPSVPRR